MTETTKILKPVETEEIKEVKESLKEVCEKALTLKIDSVESFNDSASIRGVLNNAIKKIKGTFKGLSDTNKELKRQATEAVREVTSLIEKAVAPFEAADEHVRDQRESFSKEQRRLEQIEIDKKLEIERKAAAKERERLAEIAKKADEKAAELKAAGKTELAAAEKEKADLKREQVEEVYEKPVEAEKKVETKTKTDEGTLYNKTTVKVQLPETGNEIRAFCKAVAEGNIPANCVKFSLREIQQWAKQNEKKGHVYGLKIHVQVDEIYKNNSK